jgi:hypothetical protein
MKPSIRSEIQRIIGNRFTERHPFKQGSAGMEWFSRMLPLAGQLTPKETEEYLCPLLDKLLLQTDCCLLCRAKLLAFAELYCSQKVARRAVGYWKLYQECLLCRPKNAAPRDFRTEIYHAIRQYHEAGERG